MENRTLGSFIRSLRNQNQMTQAQLADRLGVTDKAVSKWERDLSYPDVTLFPKLADLLGVTVNDFASRFGDDGHPSRLLRIFEMSHDIRTPLHIILGCVNMAELHYEDRELLMRYLESIRISGEYLLQSIDRLMRVADPGHTEETDSKQYPSNVQELGEYLNERAKARAEYLHGYDFTGKRILAAEDILMNREIVHEIFSRTGAEVEFAENGQQCVEMVEKAPAHYYDLILMDIMMPVMDGLEAARRIRKLSDPGKAAIPIIAISANVYEKDRISAAEAGMNAFAEKPIFIDKLFETMEKFL